MLMVTAYGRDEARRGADLAGIAQVLIKPVSASLLYDATVDVLAQAQLRAASADASAQSGPASAGPGNERDAVLAERMAPVRGARVLLVEDNEINQIVAGEILAEAGLRVEVAHDDGQCHGLGPRALPRSGHERPRRQAHRARRAVAGRARRPATPARAALSVVVVLRHAAFVPGDSACIAALR
jgi:CheY-like chemotaxis protein